MVTILGNCILRFSGNLSILFVMDGVISYVLPSGASWGKARKGRGTKDFDLPARALVSVEGDLRGVRISCRSGLVWLTQKGDFRDHTLKAGGELAIHRKGKVLIQCLDDAHFTISGLNSPEPVK